MRVDFSPSDEGCFEEEAAAEFVRPATPQRPQPAGAWRANVAAVPPSLNPLNPLNPA
jgi:hypothetical protein